MSRTEIRPEDVMPLADYLKIRRQKRAETSAIKRNRRVEVGPVATFYFESYDTMWFQVHEMLAIEKGGEAQVPDELEAYNPLIPQGRELIATVMFEIDDPVRRKSVLSRLGGVEETMWVSVAGEKVMARAGGRCRPHQRRRQGVLGAVRAFRLHAGSDRRLPQARGADPDRDGPPALWPHRRGAGARARGTGGRLRLSRYCDFAEPCGRRGATSRRA